MEIDTYVPDVAVAGEPEDNYEVEVEEAVLFAADLVGHLEYVFVTPYRPGYAS